MVLFRVLTVVVFLLVISFGLLFLMVVWLLEDLIIAIDVAAVITKMTSKTPLQ
jgi:hypothetical protein